MTRALVVDDNPPVRMLVARALEALEWQVDEAGDARQALSLLADAPVDILVTDVSLAGGASGLELASRIRAVCPGLRVLYVSGHDRGELARMAEREGMPVPVDGPSELFIRKPFGLEELRRSVRRLLTADCPAP